MKDVRRGSDTMHERIRRRREERAIPAYVLAHRLGISPSYVSLIESGKKVPGPDIARRLAEALEDDVELYVAWASSARIEDLKGYTDGLVRWRTYSDDPMLRRRLRSGQDLAAPSQASAPAAKARSSGPDVVSVPLLAEGTDPAASPPALAGPPLRLDARLFDEEDRDRLFAYRASADMARHAAGAFRAGDWLILTSRVEAGDAKSVFAVRTRDGIVLSRVLAKGPEMLLLPPPGESDYEILAVRDRSDVGRVLAGRVVLRLRAN